MIIEPTRFLTPELEAGRLTMRMEDDRLCAGAPGSGLLVSMRRSIRASVFMFALSPRSCDDDEEKD